MMRSQLKYEIHRLHAEICSALADPSRILILYALFENASNVSSLAQRVELPQPTTSRHLKILRERGLVVAVRHGQSMVYSLADERIITALDLLRSLLAAKITNQAALVNSAAELT